MSEQVEPTIIGLGLELGETVAVALEDGLGLVDEDAEGDGDEETEGLGEGLGEGELDGGVLPPFMLEL